ncbi:MAG: hypothetical protein K2J62_08790 [Bacteroidales bacterium]|nr:hypothetical protein [Bacteroidales bacterium]
MKRFPNKVFFLIAEIILAVSCGNNADVAKRLDAIENYIDTRPDSALLVLKNISKDGFLTKKQRARHALLYSIALDKNYVDIRNDSLINISVSYYKHHGTADEKLKSYYYQGRIYNNSGDNEAAMRSFVQAESFVPNAEDHQAIARLYYVMSSIYKYLFDFSKAYVYAEKAGMHYYEDGDLNRYAGALLVMANIKFMLDDAEASMAIMNQVVSLWDEIDLEKKTAYFDGMIQMNMALGAEPISALVDNYIKTVGRERVAWLTVADWYINNSDFSKAQKALDAYRSYNPDYRNDPVYHIHVSELCDSLGDYRQALDAYRSYSHITDSVDLVIFSQDTRFIQERHEKELRILTERNKRIKIIFILIILILIFVYAMVLGLRRLKIKDVENMELAKENEHYQNLYKQLSMEKEDLIEILSRQNDRDDAVMSAVSDRLNLLNRFFAASITLNAEIDRKAVNDLESLVKDRERFLDTTRMTFLGTHPDFVHYLEAAGLNDEQIGHCCLYAIGLKGNEISRYINKKSHYNDTSEIRKRLGLNGHDTNLGIFLRQLLTSK